MISRANRGILATKGTTTCSMTPTRSIKCTIAYRNHKDRIRVRLRTARCLEINPTASSVKNRGRNRWFRMMADTLRWARAVIFVQGTPNSKGKKRQSRKAKKCRNLWGPSRFAQKWADSPCTNRSASHDDLTIPPFRRLATSRSWFSTIRLKWLLINKKQPKAPNKSKKDRISGVIAN